MIFQFGRNSLFSSNLVNFSSPVPSFLSPKVEPSLQIKCFEEGKKKLGKVPQNEVRKCDYFYDLRGSWSMGSKVVPRATLEAPKRVPLAPIWHRKASKCLPDLMENIVSNCKGLLDFIRISC